MRLRGLNVIVPVDEVVGESSEMMGLWAAPYIRRVARHRGREPSLLNHCLTNARHSGYWEWWHKFRGQIPTCWHLHRSLNYHCGTVLLSRCFFLTIFLISVHEVFFESFKLFQPFTYLSWIFQSLLTVCQPILCKRTTWLLGSGYTPEPPLPPVKQHFFNISCLWLSPLMQRCRNVLSCVRNAAGGSYMMASASDTSSCLYFSKWMASFCGPFVRRRPFTVSHSRFLFGHHGICIIDSRIVVRSDWL